MSADPTHLAETESPAECPNRPSRGHEWYVRQLVGKRITFCRDCGYGWEKADGLPIYLLRYKTLPDQLRYLAGKLISTAERIDDPPQRFEIGAVSFCLHMLADTLVIDGDAAP